MVGTFFQRQGWIPIATEARVLPAVGWVGDRPDNYLNESGNRLSSS